MTNAVDLQRLFKAFDAYAALSKHSDAEIAEMLNEVWAEYPIASPKTALIENAMERLHRSGAGALEDSP